MRTVSLLLLAALVASGPAQAFQLDDVTLEFDNHEETLDDALDQTSGFDPLLGPTGACTRQQAVDAAKGVYGDHDMDEARAESENCLFGQCTSLDPPLDVQASIYSCRQMVMQIIDNIIEEVFGPPADMEWLHATVSV